MNLKLRRTLSSFLAFVMLCSCMVVANVGTVFAADYTSNINYSTSTDGSTRTWDFTSNTNTSSIDLIVNDTIGGITVTDTTGTVRLERSGSNSLNIKSGGAIAFDVPEGSTGTINIVGSTNATNRTLTISGETMNSTTGSGASVTFDATDTSTGKLTATSGGDFKAKTITITLDSGFTFSTTTTTTYTLTGSCSGLTAGTQFTLSDGTNTYTATVGTDGATYTVTASEAFSATATLTPSLRDYSASGTVTVTAGATATEFTGSDITFTKLTLGDLAEGTYTGTVINAGLPNFQIGASNVVDELNGTAYRVRGTLTFKLAQTADVVITGKCPSTTTTNSVAISVANSSNAAQTMTYGESSGTSATINGVASGTANPDVEYTLSALPADTYTLTATSSNTSFQITSIQVTNVQTPVEDKTYTWLASDASDTEAQVVIFGSAQTFGTTTRSGDTSVFAETIFEDGTGNIASKDCIKTKSVSFTPKSSGTLKLYLVAANNNGTAALKAAAGTGTVAEYTAPARSGETNVSAFSFEVEAGTTYTVSGDEFQLYGAKLEGTSVDTSYAVSATVTDGTNAITGATVAFTATSGKAYTVTEADGVYTVNVDYGDSLTGVTVTKDGYDAYTDNFDPVISEATALTITLTESTQTVTVSGNVTCAGEPVNGVEVKVTLSTGATATATSGNDGAYSVTFDLPASQVTLGTVTATATVDNISYNAYTSDATAITSTATTIDVALTKVSTSTGGSVYEYDFADGSTSLSTDDVIFDFDFSGKTSTNAVATINGTSYTTGYQLTSSSDGFTFTAPADGTLEIVYARPNTDGTTANLTETDRKLDINPKVVVDGTEIGTASASGGVVTFTNLTANTAYTVSRNNTAYIYYIKFTSTGASTGGDVTSFTLSGKVTDSKTGEGIVGATVVASNGATATTENGGVFTFADLTAAVTLSVSAAGYNTYRGTTSYSSGDVDALIQLDPDTNLTVTFSVTGAANAQSNITVKKNNETSGTNVRNAGASIEFTGAPGDVFHITGTPNNVTQWDAVDGNGTIAFDRTAKEFVYTIPADATAANDYGVVFTTVSNAANTLDNSTPIGSGNENDVNYGNYGFGEDKAAIGNTDARTHMTYQFATPTMYDYNSYGYADTKYNTIANGAKANQYGILQDGIGTSVSFTVKDVNHDAGGSVYAYVDKSGATYTVSDGTNTVNVEAAGTRTRFAVKANTTYTITSTGRTYLKSIRIYNPNNVFKIIAADNLGTIDTLAGTNADLLNELGISDTTSTDTLIRVIGQVQLSGADATDMTSAINAVGDISALGFYIYDGADYNTNQSATLNGVYFYPDAATSGTTAAELDVVTFTDMVNTGVEALGSGKAYGSENSSEPEDLYCQTFVRVSQTAHPSGLVFIPYCVKDGSTIYSIVRDSEATPNFVFTFQ